MGKCVIHNGGFYLWGKCVIHNGGFYLWGKCVIHNGGFYWGQTDFTYGEDFMGQMCNS